MRPYGKSPIAAADEVCMVVRDADIIHRLYFAALGNRLDGLPAVTIGAKLLALRDLASLGPAFRADKEGMLCSGPNRMPRHPQVEQHRPIHERFLNEFGLKRRFQIVLRRGGENKGVGSL